MEQATQLIIAFAFYSFIGWCGEVIYNFVREHRWVNRGFLRGPFCLLYGVGAIGVVALCTTGTPLWATVMVAAIWSIFVEYCGSVVLEHIGLSGWDYSDKPLNLHGRICLESIATFVVGLVALVYVLHPAVAVMLQQLSPTTVKALVVLFVLYVVVDGNRQLKKQLEWHRKTGDVRGSIE